MALIRRSLEILDGVAPEEVTLAGDGWSLLGAPAPEPPVADVIPIAAHRRPETEPAYEGFSVVAGDAYVADVEVIDLPPRPSFLSMLGDALDEAMAEGWILAAEEELAEPAFSDEEEAFFVAGDEMAC